MSDTVMLVFARVAGFAIRAPGLSHPSVPAPIRVACAVGLALILAPLVAPAPALSIVPFICALASETLIGAVFGWGSSLLYDAAYYAGRAIDDAVGIRGTVPTVNVTAAQGFGRIWSGAFLVGLFLLDGYVPIVRGLAASFDALPVGHEITAGVWRMIALSFPRTFMEIAISLAFPAIAAACVAQVASALVARTVPRLAHLNLGAPLAFAAALVVTVVSLPLFVGFAGRPPLLRIHAQ